jgi:hypothetical protein
MAGAVRKRYIETANDGFLRALLFPLQPPGGGGAVFAMSMFSACFVTPSRSRPAAIAAGAAEGCDLLSSEPIAAFGSSYRKQVR